MRIIKIIFKKLFLLSIFLFLFFSLSKNTSASILFIESLSSDYQNGDIFILEIKIDTEGECINALDVDLFFPRNFLTIKDFLVGDSILKLWTEDPNFIQEKGIVSFSGGVPKGFCQKEGLIGKLVFEVKNVREEKNIEINFSNYSKILLNDGLGTMSNLSLKSYYLDLFPEREERKVNDLVLEIEKDIISPENFEIIILRDEEILNGKYFVIFSTIDIGTGVDYYKIREGNRDWKIIESPYLLEDQTLKSIIEIKAVDKAGNETISLWFPKKEKDYSLLNITSIFLIILIMFFIPKRKNN